MIGVLISLSVFTAHHRLSAFLTIERGPLAHFSEAYLLPDPATLSVIGLGHQELMADTIWLRALSYFAVHLTDDKEYLWLDRYIDTIIDLDPNFRMIYIWAGTVTMYGGQVIDNQAILSSNHFLERGLESYPFDWQINFMLGCNYLFELHPNTEEERAVFRLRGGQHLSIASEAPEAPAWLVLTVLSALNDHEESAFQLMSRTFLTQSPLNNMTLSINMALSQNYLFHGQNNTNLTTQLSSGIQLKRATPITKWWSILSYERAHLTLNDNEHSYLNSGLALLLDQEPESNWLNSTLTTPLDRIFSNNTTDLGAVHDPE
jgi:hypothetical protein